MNTLIKLIDEYSEAQKAMKAKRAQVGSWNVSLSSCILRQ
jgi:hypothetical protein